MTFSRISRAGSLMVAAGIAAGVFAAPACADTTANIDNFLTTLDGLGITDIAPGDAVELGQSLCPLLADRGQNTADIAARVSDAIGRPLGPATMFTGMAISFLCPKAVGNITDTLTNGKPLLPLFG
jgi:predicted deacylase